MENSKKDIGLTVVFDDKSMTMDEFESLIETRYGKERDIAYWLKMRFEFMDKLAENPQMNQQTKEFKEGVVAMKIFEAFFSALKFAAPSGKMQQYVEAYKNCQKPEFLEAKKALQDNLKKFSTYKKEGLKYGIFFQVKELSAYFGSFIFNMKNGHSGKYEKVLSKQATFPVDYSEESGGTVFRFMDAVNEALSYIVLDKKGKITNYEEVIQKIMVPSIWNGCYCCNSENPMTFNHETGLVEEITDKVCPFHGKDMSKLKSRIATTGKLIFCNDVRDFMKNSNDGDSVRDFGYKNGVSTLLNSWEGQNGFVNMYAEKFNVGYIVAGNHGASVKKTESGLKVTYGDCENDSLGDISLSLWAASFVDYEDAVKMAGSEAKLKKALKEIEENGNGCHILDVKPGTYEVITDCEMNEDESYDEKYDGKDVAFGYLNWIGVETKRVPLSQEEWAMLKR